MKNCKNCNAEFQPKHESRGHEQIYCSIKCRSEAYKKRSNERKSPELQQQEQENQFKKAENIGYVERKNDELLQFRSDSYYDIISLLEKLSDAKTEVVRYQLKCEAFQKENEEMKNKIYQLESEIDALEEDEDESENDMISGLMTNFKKDPVSTINFATSLFNQLIKSKTDAKATTTT